MFEELKELWRFRELLISMVQRDLRVRYKNSAIGFLWSLVNPMVTTAVMWLVFGQLLGNHVPNYAAYVLAAYLPFTFFTTSVMDSAQSVLSSLPIVKKVYFPREILPLAAVLSNFIHLLLGLCVFFVFLLAVYLRDRTVVPFQVHTFYLPILLVISLCMSMGFGLLVSALNTFYEDVKYMVGVGMYLLFFLCPIMYFMEEVAANPKVQRHAVLFKLYNLNPIASLSTAYRQCLLAPPKTLDTRFGPQTPLSLNWGWVAYDACFAAVLLVVGYTVFNRMKWRFVERP